MYIIACLTGQDIGNLVGQMMGLPGADDARVTPTGRDVTFLCNISAFGGFESDRWTTDGWVLNQHSLDNLMAEFPEEFQ